MPIPIPSTLARLQPYISIRTVAGGMDMSDLSTLNAALADTTSVLEIATISEMDIQIKRDTHVWREFSSTRPGLPREVVPGLVNYELTIKKIMLNKDMQNSDATKAESLMTLFGFNKWQGGFDILAQHQSALIYIDMLSPTTANGSATATSYPGTKTLVFYGCWFDSLPLKFSLSSTGDMTIEQETKAVNA